MLLFHRKFLQRQKTQNEYQQKKTKKMHQFDSGNAMHIKLVQKILNKLLGNETKPNN